jgi:hypothetical protein
MFSIASVEKITLSCGTMPMRARSASRATRSTRAPSIAPRPLDVVEAQDQLEHRALARAARADQRHRLAGRDLEAEAGAASDAAAATDSGR